jgi:serine/threonine protein kinase
VVHGAPFDPSDDFCPPEETLLRLLDSDGDPDEREGLLAHLDSCSGCRLAIVEITRAKGGQSPAAQAGLHTLAPGERVVGRYEIRRFIARGGMGEVYEAIDLQGGQRLALKTMAATVLDDDDAAFRLRGEARLAGRVNHPNVCRILDSGIHDQRGTVPDSEPIPFLTMELLEGVTLTRRIAGRGALAIEAVAPLMGQIVAGLGAIHAAGIVHRDLKSENVFLIPAPEGERAILMDFGLARALDGSVLTTMPHLSLALMGTLECMAPEQIDGAKVGPAADIYALGVLLFELLTGKRPFRKVSPAVRLTSPPPLPSAIAPVLAHWDPVVARCLARRPEDRFARPADVLAALPVVRR